ncbi:hypothetical protein KAFR_0A06620 [Kazachstania africana CBS 2517]|uniref:Actin interacting protein 3 C-terminal domain-containing protein n=1 Tax=Kazachstania africana (strain ATCC 22294 / BCRC 22015 / CBS 2517 / CECT 1963 / NBRC 1671 / NRRL Y-8276) TaxID=1071382 RepID=H2ANZ7_KAZAF|nr:hypothetical protein KAFR_0A06620 [Kazachstania africana CBS 2517]CCF56097.1 hypothetical protein KAFR_0A06620 [Kazachstania africana CBS 2517]
MSSSNEELSRSTSNSVRSSMSVETTVTKLLMSTKHLLQVLTQWSKGAATGKMVSDAYVQLGNDFKLVTKFFTHSDIDVSDLGDVPMELRKVLEVTLREPASDDTLNKFLPSIRTIIVSLLDRLKVKQAELKILKQEHRAFRNSHKQKSSVSTVTISPTSSISQQKPSNVTGSNDQIQKGSKKDTIENEQPTNGSQDTENQDNRGSKDEDALAQLKKGTNLERRASKRYSAYHMARLTNQSTTEAAAAAAVAAASVPSSVSSTLLQVPKDDFKTSVDSNTEKKAAAGNDAMEQEDTYTLFLSLYDKTKRCHIPKITTMNGLRLLFVELFAYSPGGDTFPDIYVRDPNYSVFYELDEHSISNLKDGSILKLRLESESTSAKDTISGISKIIKEEIMKSQNEILNNLKSYNAFPAIAPALSIERTPSNGSAASSGTLKNVKHELAIIKQLQKDNKSEMEKVVQNIIGKINKFKETPVVSATGSAKAYMEKSQSELGQVSDGLLSRVDDLQDIIEILRKDVAERGARPSKKKLESLAKDLKKAEVDLNKMQQFIDTEKPQWKRIWEAELDKVCEEQQFLTLQEDLIMDLNEDLNKAQETYNLIDLCFQEQEKNPQKVKVNPILPILKPGTFGQVREQVMLAVQSINPNYDSRIDALEKAEKLWEKEKQYKEDTAFRDELGRFVESSSLKKSGGVEEIEKVRKQKDEENLRAVFGTNI